MTPSEAVELQRKCRRLVYDKNTGAVAGLISGGGATEGLTGDALIMATFVVHDELGNDVDPTTVFGIVEEYFSPRRHGKAVTIDLTKVDACHAAVEAHRAVKKAEVDFTEECGAACFGNADMTVAQLARALKLKSYLPDEGVTAEMITEHQAKQVELRDACDEACCTLLAARDVAVTYQTRLIE